MHALVTQWQSRRLLSDIGQVWVPAQREVSPPGALGFWEVRVRKR
jgi:hypothetical protein